MQMLCCVQLLLGRFSGVVSAAAKAKAWEELARDITGVSGIVRTGQEIHKKWICVKSGVKAVTVEQRIVGVIGKVAVDGVAGGFDSAVTPASTSTEVTALSVAAMGVYCIIHILILRSLCVCVTFSRHMIYTVVG